MRKKWSLYIGTFVGISVYIHWSFVLLIGWIFMSNYKMGNSAADALWSVGFLLAIFACVVLHEFGHALTARRFNIATRDVTLYPIGGIASLESMPEKPTQELQVAIAGPLVNVVIATILGVVLQATNSMPTMQDLQHVTEVQQVSFTASLLGANLLLAAFNMIPAFPMDGGRVLRALLAFKMDRMRATRWAARVGQFLAFGFMLFGFFYDFWLVFIGLFIYLGAGGEVAYENTRSILGGYRVRDVLMTRYVMVSPSDQLAAAVERLLDSQDQEFLVTSDGRVEGVLSRRDLIAGLKSLGRAAPISAAMRTDFIVLAPDTPLDEVYKQMNAKKCNAFPVMDDGRLVGMVDRENINELIMVRTALAQ